ncbi:hypothetical protein F2P81_018971 [Scophthalmus maximus]|uniref:Uncharacterized protein n=1 Tax=Scophthalmus maximus TaxID=52904 RepID=A0A6A4S3S1_SCOMX|nr:hypothetical protein F2P81_018971 [Scophthalmus maximus]
MDPRAKDRTTGPGAVSVFSGRPASLGADGGDSESGAGSEDASVGCGSDTFSSSLPDMEQETLEEKLRGLAFRKQTSYRHTDSGPFEDDESVSCRRRAAMKRLRNLEFFPFLPKRFVLNSVERSDQSLGTSKDTHVFLSRRREHRSESGAGLEEAATLAEVQRGAVRDSDKTHRPHTEEKQSKE